VVYYGYLPGYIGSFAYDGVVVYGTGYHYRPWFGHFYVARPYTYGFSARYDWASRHWGFEFAAGFGGGDGWFGVGVDRERHDRWFGYGGYRPVYARDRAHVAAGFRAMEEDRGRRGPDVGVYDRRDDHHADVRVGEARDDQRGGQHGRDYQQPRDDRQRDVVQPSDKGKSPPTPQNDRQDSGRRDRGSQQQQGDQQQGNQQGGGQQRGGQGQRGSQQQGGQQ
jgi:hypothetical protein